MSEYYSVAVPAEKKIYALGTKSSACFTLPFFICTVLEDNSFVFYHDGGFLEDKYEYDLLYKVVDYDSIALMDVPFAESIQLSVEEFKVFYENLKGKEVNRSEFEKIIKELPKFVEIIGGR